MNLKIIWISPAILITRLTTLNTWTTEGIYTTGTTIIGTQHFDLGNEDFEMDEKHAFSYSFQKWEKK